MKTLITSILLTAIATISFSQGYYLEFKMTSDGNGVSGDMKAYHQNGDTRTDIAATIPGMGAMNMATLVKKDNPNTVYMLNEKDKTYTEISTQTNEDWKDYPQSEYQVTVIGKEKVNNFNSTHVKVKRKGSSFSDDMWLSTDLDGYNEYMQVKSKYTGKDNLNKALAAKGVAGFPVRIKTQDNKQMMQIDLLKAEKRNNPTKMFTLVGYKKGAGMMSPAGIDANQLMKDMQNMSPEEQQKMIQDMMKQYQPK